VHRGKYTTWEQRTCKSLAHVKGSLAEDFEKIPVYDQSVWALHKSSNSGVQQGVEPCSCGHRQTGTA